MRSDRQGRTSLHLLWLCPGLTVLGMFGVRSLEGHPVGLGSVLAAAAVGALVGLSSSGFLVVAGNRRTRRFAASQQMLTQIAHESPDPICISARDGRITFFNAAAARMFGYDATEVVGTHAADYYVEGKEGARKLLARLGAEGGTLRDHRARFVRKDGQPFVAQVSATVLCGELGERSGVLAVFREAMGMAVVSEAQLRSARLRALGESLASIAHELRNPLTTVLGFLQIATDPSKPVNRDGLTHALKAAERMARTLRMMLAYARGSAPEKRPVQLNEVVREVIDFMSIELRHAGVDLVLRTEPLPVTLADSGQIQQVLMNLIANARDAVAERPASRVAVSTGFRDGAICVRVSDNGPGLAPALRKRVFAPFFTTKERSAGSGLGLAICRQFVQAHRGRIWIADSSTGGCAVTFSLPLVAPAGRSESSSDTGTQEFTGSGRILIVDDEEGLRELCEAALSDRFEIVTVDSGEQAIARIARERFDCVVCDFRLGGDLDGPEVFERVRLHRPELATRFALMTGDTEDLRAVIRVEELGVPVIAKPFDVAHFTAFVSELASRPGEPALAGPAGAARTGCG